MTDLRSSARGPHTGAAALAGAGLALLVALAAPASAQEFMAGDITVEQPWARATPAGAQVAAGYMVIRNAGSAPDRLVAVRAEISDRAEIHTMAVDDTGVMTMRLVGAGWRFPPAARSSSSPAAIT